MNLFLASGILAVLCNCPTGPILRGHPTSGGYYYLLPGKPARDALSPVSECSTVCFSGELVLMWGYDGVIGYYLADTELICTFLM
ncbi:hypothetical protein BDQ94DRAFT_147950 [Aspergillus welwitschiae]|uniref:Uncharacterized protein n=1 Tax=Aspergillus welwitschiae TaxID=1341132 RepID=A0A3F3PVU8_9EURO|nr:hypothetical protein BDQ94DRAFT_147950 [Aspergillus welwitschiae]RDH31067.1 hypothetical protein BDQ94DRAFT_147950 [Aspergillus welwitschiae]